MGNTQPIGPTAVAVVEAMRALRLKRKWSAVDLENRIAATGLAVMPRNTIANLETGRRAMVTVDELAALGGAFRVEPWSLTTGTPVCLTCRGQAPPAGFACMSCGQGSEVTNA
jgi:transcriptional regulator with XRE-family HTH domain